MKVFSEYLSQIEEPMHRARMQEILSWVAGRFPDLKPRIAWKQPMFTDHGTYIIGFGVSKNHIAVAPEKQCLGKFAEEIERAGYAHSKELLRIKWDNQIDYELLRRMIEHNISDKAGYTLFWRKPD